jgi:YD repeat-containing protein
MPPILERAPERLLGVRGLATRQVRLLTYSSERFNIRAFAAPERLRPRRRAAHIQCCPRQPRERLAGHQSFPANRVRSATGQRTNLTDVSGTTSYSYDNRDRLQLKTVAWSGGPTISLNYRFDANGNLTNLWSSSSGGVTNFYQFDALNRLTNVLADASAAAGYGFDAAGNLQTVRYGNGVTNQFQYDLLNRLTNAVWKLNAST